MEKMTELGNLEGFLGSIKNPSIAGEYEFTEPLRFVVLWFSPVAISK